MTRLFRHETRERTEASRALYARYELIRTAIDFAAALCFVAGSVMFFSSAWTYTGTWAFLVGSLCFAAKPTVKIAREVHLYRIGDLQDLAAEPRP